ncbi:MAG: ABC transporter permease [Planctomycetota bacterium]
MNGTTSPDVRYHPLWALTLSRIWEFIREPDAIFWVYIFPLVLMAALGIAFRNRPAEDFRIAVQQGAAAEAVVAQLQNDARFRASICPLAECRLKLRTGRADVVILAADSSAGAQYEYLFDPDRPESVLARHVVDGVLQQAAGRRDAAIVTNRPVQEPGSRYIDFLVPGLLGMGLMGGGLWGVGFAVVDLRLRKLLKRYLATPMRRGHFLASLVISRLIFTATEVTLLLAFARIFFQVACFGSYALVGLLILLGSLQFAAIGLLVACRARTIETVMGLMNAVMLPMWIASGIFFTIERFPEAVQPWLRLLPLTPLISALRAVMLEGAGLASIGTEIAVIIIWGAASAALALRWFRWV